MHTQPTPRPIEPSLLGRRILVVEDHPDSRDLLTTSFRLVGARVLAVGSLAEAQRGVDRFRPELVVCDLKLPDGTGLDFAVWLRARAKVRAATRRASRSPASNSTFHPIGRSASTHTCASPLTSRSSATSPPP